MLMQAGNKFFTVFFFLLCSLTFAQQHAEVESTAENTKKSIPFTHVPILVFRLNPWQMLRYDNNLQYGIEIAPPVGKFSFVFDYGRGKGKGSTFKEVKNKYSENFTRVYRAEIKGYFSDWYDFAALDKKPFGRYYSLSYEHNMANRNLVQKTFISGVDEEKLPYKETRQELRVNIGKHFHIHKHFFLELKAGAGLGRYNVPNPDNINSESFLPLELSKRSQRYVHAPGEKGLFFSRGLGLNLVFPL